MIESTTTCTSCGAKIYRSEKHNCLTYNNKPVQPTKTPNQDTYEAL